MPSCFLDDGSPLAALAALQVADVVSLRSINGVRTTRAILDAVPNHETFRAALLHVSFGFRFGGAGRHHIGAPLQRGGLADQQRPAWAAQHHPLAGKQGVPPLAPLPQHPQLGGAVHGRRASDLLVGEMDCGVVSQ